LPPDCSQALARPRHLLRESGAPALPTVVGPAPDSILHPDDIRHPLVADGDLAPGRDPDAREAGTAVDAINAAVHSDDEHPAIRVPRAPPEMGLHEPSNFQICRSIPITYGIPPWTASARAVPIPTRLQLPSTMR